VRNFAVDEDIFVSQVEFVGVWPFMAMVLTFKEAQSKIGHGDFASNVVLGSFLSNDEPAFR
jgi:hypothetical protein